MNQMNEEWVSFWYQCLSENSDYSSYCSAREQGNSARCLELERRFDCVAEIYADFGPLDGWPDGGITSQRWKSWFLPRKHLFMPDVRELVDLDTSTPTRGELVLAIPLQSSVDGTVDAVRQYLDSLYRERVVVPPAPPKYQLRMSGIRVAHGFEQVRQAVLTSLRSYAFHPETMEYVSIKECTIEFLRHELDNLGWTLDPVARQELMEHGQISEDRYEGFKVRINKCRRDFKAFASNVMRKSFPDDRAFGSDVIDQFLGE